MSSKGLGPRLAVACSVCSGKHAKVCCSHLHPHDKGGLYVSDMRTVSSHKACNAPTSFRAPCQCSETLSVRLEDTEWTTMEQRWNSILESGCWMHHRKIAFSLLVLYKEGQAPRGWPTYPKSSSGQLAEWDLCPALTASLHLAHLTAGHSHSPLWPRALLFARETHTAGLGPGLVQQCPPGTTLERFLLTQLCGLHCP